MKQYDIIIVGAGAAGAFAAYEFTRLNTSKKVLIIDKGNPIERRKCPITEGKVDHCIHCKPCNIMSGYGGAGTLSDGKYNITGSAFPMVVGKSVAGCAVGVINRRHFINP